MKSLQRASRLSAFVMMLFAVSLNPASSSNKTGTSLVRIPYKGPAQIKSFFDRGMDVLGMSARGYLDVVADARQIEYLSSLGYPISAVGTPEMRFASSELDDSLGDYHTFGEMKNKLLALEAQHPALADLQSVGSSIQGRPIYMLKISDNVALDEEEPEVLIMGCHHAREIMSVEIPLLFAQYLLTNYGSNPEVTALVDTREIFIVPMVNPDGHVYVQHHHEAPWFQWWRKNRRDNGDGTFGVDPNRNYSYKWGYDNIGSSPVTSSWTYRGTGPFSEPETQAIRDFCQSRHIALALSYHSYGEMLLYPWGYYHGYTTQHELCKALGDTLTDFNGYAPGNVATGVIYLTNGTTDDWAYGDSIAKDPFLCFTPEINSLEEGGFAPPEELIQPTFNKLIPMNMLVLELADDPHRILGPYAPAMYAIQDPYYPIFTLSWSGNVPSDPNPVASYDVIEYKNMTTLSEDPAESLSPLWNFDGFTIGGRAYEGSGSYYSDRGDNLSNHLEIATSYNVTEETETFSFWTWYDTEADYDYAYCQVSTDEGVIWTPIEGNITTNYNPYGNNLGNGITGSSGGWIHAVFPLETYLGSEIRLRISYITDGAVDEEGIYVDLPGPVPTYERLSTIASGHADTTLLVLPSEVGHFTYRVRARDAHGDPSHWSGSVSIQIDDVTIASDLPRLESRLGVNYPNPFNPATRIPYTVGSTGRGVLVPVTLKIYSVTGHLVATLVDQPLAPDSYTAVWRGQDDEGRPVSSGVYFARLTVGRDETFTRKLVLLK